MKERVLNVAHKTLNGCLVGLTLVGVYHSSRGVYGIITRRIAYQKTLSDAAVADKK